MIFYSIKAKDKDNYNSRRWLVDSLGLRIVKNHYMTYPKDKNNVDNGETINRWDEFEVKKVDTIGFDFGGMMYMGTPTIKEQVGKTLIQIPVTHIEYLIMVMKKVDVDREHKVLKSDKKYVYFGTRFWNYIMSIPHKNAILKVFTKKEKLYEEMIEGLNKEMDRVAKEVNILQMQKYHKEKPQ